MGTYRSSPVEAISPDCKKIENNRDLVNGKQKCIQQGQTGVSRFQGRFHKVFKFTLTIGMPRPQKPHFEHMQQNIPQILKNRL